MVLSDEKKKDYIKRLLLSRMRILCNNGFYGLLLMHMIYSIDENCETAATDGCRIFFTEVSGRTQRLRTGLYYDA